MNKIILPAQLNPIARRKDKSVKLSFETRELQSDEILTLMSLEGAEMWIALAPNQEELPETPTEPAELQVKSQSARLNAVLYILWKQQTKKGKYVGLFETFKRERMEQLIEVIKSKLESYG